MNPLQHCDQFGVPWRGSTRKTSPYYYPKGKDVTVIFNGRQFVEAGIVEFDRKEGWLLVRPWKGGPLEKVHGTVEVFRIPKLGLVGN